MPRIILYTDQAASDLPHAVQQFLQHVGATDVRRSHPELPGVYTAQLPKDADAPGIVRQLAALPGLRHAELDPLRSAHGVDRT